MKAQQAQRVQIDDAVTLRSGETAVVVKTELVARCIDCRNHRKLTPIYVRTADIPELHVHMEQLQR